MIINTSAGGAALNFKVVGGTAQPANPKENTIWVNTSANITSWVFSTTQPANPVEGMVWIRVSDNSSVSFNALKNKQLCVYPVACKQYVNGSWLGKEAKSYINGAWQNWLDVLFKSGDQYGAITGGWGGYQERNVKVSIGSSLKISGTGTNDQNTYASFYTKDPVDVSNFNTLKLDEGWNLTGSGASAYFGLSPIKPNSNSNTNSVHNGNYVARSSGNSSLDISKISGKYYVYATVYISGSKNYTATVQTSEVKLL